MAALLAAAALALTACAGSDDKGEPDDGGDRGASLATTSDADWKPVADILGRTGKLNDGSVYKIGFARSDLSVQTKGVTVAPALSLGSWVAFARTPDGQTMLMGDLVVTEDELASVTDAVQAGGLQQTALHKHLLEQSPPIWWTHIAGHGDAADLARAVRSALDATDTPPPAPATSGQTSLDLDTAAIDEALGRSGTIAGGVYKFFIARRDPVTMSGMLIPPVHGSGYRPQLPAHRQRPRGDQRRFRHDRRRGPRRRPSTARRRNRHRRHTQPRVRRTTTPVLHALLGRERRRRTRPHATRRGGRHRGPVTPRPGAYRPAANHRWRTWSCRRRAMTSSFNGPCSAGILATARSHGTLRPRWPPYAASSRGCQLLRGEWSVVVGGVL